MLPLAYLITFSCYGSRLHGDERGSVDSAHNAYRGDFISPQPEWHRVSGQAMKQAPYELDAVRRAVVLDTIVEVSAHRRWTLRAVHVRTKHAHVVVSAGTQPERVMTDYKAYASRALNRAGHDAATRQRWSRHGSTIYLWKEEAVSDAILCAESAGQAHGGLETLKFVCVPMP